MDKDPKTVTGEIIAEARRKKGYTQEALAETLGVTRQAVSRWESGSAYPETENLVRLAKLLDLDLNYLLKGEQSETPSESNAERDNVRIMFPLPFGMYRYEYKSKRTLFGLPLVHINVGYGVYRAKGVIAIGNIATGIVSIGIIAVGLLSIGILAAGALAIGMLAAGLFSGGPIALGLIAAGAIAVGGMTFGAISVGGFAFGALSIGGYVAVGEHAYGGIVVAMTHGQGSVATFISTSADTLSYDRDALMAAIDANVPKFWIWFISVCKALL